MSDRLFVYGTLHPDKAPPEISGVVKRMRQVGQGTVVGTLHRLGHYPGLVLKGQNKVPGTIFELPDDPDAWDKLDAYEEYFPSQPERSLFLRQKLPITLSTGERRQHWVYVYNRPLPSSASPSL